MKPKERLREAFEPEEVLDALEEWLKTIEQRFAQKLLSASDADLLKAKHQYEAARQFHRDFLTIFDKDVVRK